MRRIGCVFVFLLFARLLPAQIDSEVPGNTGEGSGLAPPRRAEISILDQNSVNWDKVMLQSGFFLGVKHGFRLWTEQGTRDGLKGPFFRDWGRAVGSMHGWADGDPFYVNYVGHAMQGAVSAYIFTQNDIPRYRYVEFGKNRDYWMSRLRATAFSWAYSTQFEIGPLSEASLGNVQALHPAYGFVDHVATPAVGLLWMIAEDALDKYVIKPFEGRYENRWARLLVRSWLNPSRSFGNAMGFTMPWRRDTRPNLFHDDMLGRYIQNELKANGRVGPRIAGPGEKKANSVIAPAEFTIQFQPTYYLGGGGALCLGGNSSFGFRVAERWQALFEVGGCKQRGMGQDWSGDSLTYMAGIRYAPWARGRWSASVRALAGGEKLTHELFYPQKYETLKAAWRAAGKDPKTQPRHEDFAYANETNGFAMSSGAALDYRLNPALQLKVASLDFRRSWVSPMDGRVYNRSVSLTTGFVLRLGSW